MNEEHNLLTVADSQRQLNQQIRQVSGPLSQASTWMKIVSVLGVVSAVVTLLFRWWYLLYLWLPLWTSILLFQAATRAEKAATSGSREQLSEALDKLRLYFKITGILAVIGILVFIVSLIVALPHWLRIWGHTF